MHLQSTHPLTSVLRTHNEQMIISSVNDAGKAGYPMQKNGIGPLSHIIYKNQLKIDYRLEHNTWNSKWLEENIREKILNISLGNDILNKTPKAHAPKAERQVGLHQIKKLLNSKGNNQQNER